MSFVQLTVVLLHSHLLLVAAKTLPEQTACTLSCINLDGQVTAEYLYSNPDRDCPCFSIASSQFPTAHKHALITPILKKLSLDHAQLTTRDLYQTCRLYLSCLNGRSLARVHRKKALY